MRSSFDDELRKRLRSYREEPRRDLWEGIAKHITSVEPRAFWQIWLSRLRVMVLALVLLISSDQVTNYTERTDQMRVGAEPLSESHKPLPNKRIEMDRDQRTDIDARRNLDTSANDDFAATGSRSQRQHVLNSGNSIRRSGANQPVFVAPFSVRRESLDGLTNLIMQTTGEVIQSLHRNDAAIVNARPPVNARPMDKETLSGVVDAHGNRSAETADHQHRSRYSIYLTAMPTFGYQRIEANRDDIVYIERIKRISAFSTDRLGIRVEAGIEVPFSRRLGGFAGILYFQRHQTIDYTERQVANINVRGSEATALYESEYTYLQKTVEHELKNIGMQLGVVYSLDPDKNDIPSRQKLSLRVRRKRFSHIVGTGLEFHKSLKPSPQFSPNAAFSDPSLYVFFNAYYRVQYTVNARLKAIFQPTFNYSVYLHEDLGAPFYVKPFGLGLNLGCTYGL